MIRPIRSERFSNVAIRPEDFEDDGPFIASSPAPLAPRDKDVIAGVEFIPLSRNEDKRGALIELSIFEQEREPVVHVYQVFAAPGSVRAWVYHKRQSDRLAYTHGEFEIVLFDLRADSETYGMLNVFHLGDATRTIIRIPPLVVHGVKNIGKQMSSFVNMPTRRYDPANPDKSRISRNDLRIPYTFDER